MVDTISTSIWATTPLLGIGIPGIYRSLDQASSWSPYDANLNTNRTMFLALGYYPLLGTQHSGIWSYHEVGIHEDKRLQELNLFSVYPNPTRGPITIDYDLTRRSDVRIRIIDCAGRVIEELVNKVVGPGHHNTVFQSELPSGVYFVDLKINGLSSTGRFVVIK
jgi:hypothetical protein